MKEKTLKVDFYLEGECKPHTETEKVRHDYEPNLYGMVKIADKQFNKLVSSAVLFIDGEVVKVFGPSDRGTRRFRMA